MFGRKRKQDEESIGLAGLGTGGVSPSIAPAVSVSAQPATPQTGPEDVTPHATPTTAEAPFGIPGLTPGVMPTNAAAMLGEILSGHGPVGELVAQIRSDPEGFRQRMMAQAEAAGVSTAMTAQQWGVQPAGAAPAPKPVDVIDELTKAANLHHEGVLSDAEFEAYKKKLLGE